MKQRKLKKWVKIILTVIVIAISTLIYLKTQEIGKLAQTSSYYEAITITCWVWLLFGQLIVITSIWEN